MRGIRRKLTLRRANGRLALLALAVVAMLAVAACGGDDDSDSTTADETTADETTTTDAATTEEPPVEVFRAAVGSLGTIDDESFSQAQFEGAVALGESDPAYEVTIVPNLLTPDQYLQQGAALAEEGYDLVLWQHGSMVEVTQQLAEQFPDTTFGVIFDPPDDFDFPPNFIGWDFIAQEGSFLAGALAALATETDVVAAISGVPFPAITRQPEGFELGARCVNPDITTLQTYTGDETFSDARVTRGAVEAQIGDGADVIFAALDGAVNGAYQAAEAADVSVIAQYFDSSGKSDAVLASVLYNAQNTTVDLIVGEATEGYGGTEQIYDLDRLDVGTLAPGPKLAEALSDEEQALLADIEVMVRGGEIQVPESEALAEPGDAAGIDPVDLGCPEGGFEI